MMTDTPDESEAETRRLVVAITDFLRDQLIIRTDLVPEDKDCLEIAIQCLEMAYGLEGNRYIQYRFSRPLMDIFSQVTNPVSIKDKIQADAHKDEGNNCMRRRMFENAEREYTNAIELDKWNAIYYCNRASARIEQSNFFEAIADCRQALMLNPDYAKAQARMGQAYALIHRPREAARCFRQALQLEPENERYRHNLRVAENQIDRPDIGQQIATLLGSLLGLGPTTGEDRSTRMLPTSFMIITESHPATTGTSSQSAEISEITGNSQVSQSTTASKNDTNGIVSSNSSMQPITFPPPFGVINEGEEEEPLPEFEPLSEVENLGNPEEEEFVINIPLFSFDIGPRTQSSFLQRESSLQSRVNTQEEITEKMPNAPNKETVSKDNSKLQENVIHKTNIPNSPNELSEAQNQLEKTTKHAPAVGINGKVADTVNKELKKDLTAKTPFNNAKTKDQSKTNSNLCQENKVLSTIENSQVNPNSSGSGYNFTDDNENESETCHYKSKPEKDEKSDEQNSANETFTINEASDEGETSEKHISLEEEVD